MEWGLPNHFWKDKRPLLFGPVLAFADFSKPFTLHTDASGIGLGAVLYQELQATE